MRAELSAAGHQMALPAVVVLFTAALQLELALIWQLACCHSDSQGWSLPGQRR